MKINPTALNYISVFILLLTPVAHTQTLCTPIPNGIYVADDNADEIGKEGSRDNIIRLLKNTEKNQTATTFEFSVALLKNGDQLSLFRNIGNELDEKYTNLSVRAVASFPAVCESSGAWLLQTSQYYPEDLNFFGKPRRKSRKLPEPVRMFIWLESVELGVLRINNCKAEVQKNGKWTPFGKYDSVDLCLNLKSSRIFDIRPDIHGRQGWQGAF
ncbi:hypothetical protein [Vogesella sp. LIG4]|uniref:hypothetical protein n=1 Tax=Vogesella sp. LIG4 TaxID=1192162 RepID=UPI00081FB592|nr:hypothetical protein [Vogesella sp. LIG4]SCK21593.1 hypothetical protein PSELUDRAFT_2466 [Vogesella sp. LIG4]